MALLFGGMRVRLSFNPPVYKLTPWMRKTCNFGSRRFQSFISLAVAKPSEAVRVHSCVLHTGTVLCSLDSKNDGKKTSSSSQESVFKQIMKRKEDPKQLSLPGKVFQAGKDITFLVAIVGGLLVAGGLFYNVAREFMAADSPAVIFSLALRMVKEDPRVVEALGEPITGHGEESGRNRRKHIPHQEYIVDGESYMRLKFYVSGSKRKGNATIDLKKDAGGMYQCRFLMVEFPPNNMIMVVDNR